jgi:dynein heavy chain, axonemal
MARIANSDGEAGHLELRSLLFAEFLLQDADLKPYVEVTEGIEQLAPKMQQILDDYNAASKSPLSLVLFAWAIEHICRICRILGQPGGHALLVGLGGSGRQSLTKLAAFAKGFTLCQVQLSGTFSRADWCDFLRGMLRTAGEKANPVVFLMSDTQITDELMIEDVSNLLSTGEVPSLFDTTDQIAIGEAMQPAARKVEMDGSRAELWAFFCSEVSRSLHIVLAFSPVGHMLRNRLRKFPSLSTCCTINWCAAG